MAQIGGVLCCGNIVLDVVVYPVDDIGWDQTMWVDTIAESIGGNGANTSWVLAKMRVPVRLLSLVGDDQRGEKLLGMLTSSGIDTSGVRCLRGHATPATCVLVQPGGARKFYHRPGASREIDPDALDLTSSGHSHFHLANPFSMSKVRMRCGDVMRRAKEAGLTTSLDTGWDSLGRWMEDLGPALRYTDLLFVNDAEAEMLGGEARLRQSGVQTLVVKTGAEGCRVNGERVSGFVVDAVDSTGAGDCFAGAFLAGLHRGLPLIECARFANAVGAMNVEQLGATTGIRDYEETLAWIAARENS